MLKKIILIPIIIFSVSVSCYALPNGWVLTIFNQTYTDLSSPTFASLANGWDDPDVRIPVSFMHNAFGQSTDTLYTSPSHGGALFTSTNVIPNIYSLGIDVIDRSLAGGSTLPSTISYITAGNIGNRITKIQWENFGFKGEYLTDFTLNDSGNIQVWFYESDNSFEYRFGASQVSDFQRNVQGPNLQMGIISAPWLYYVNSLAPAILDSTMNSSAPTGTYGIASYPTNGTVIRFGPTAVGLNNLVKLNDNITFYPSVATDKINIEFANERKEKAEIKIFDLNGRLQSNQIVENKKNILDVSHLANGNYILNVHENRQSVFYQFTKN